MFNSLTILHDQNPEVEKGNQKLTCSMSPFTIKDMFSSNLYSFSIVITTAKPLLLHCGIDKNMTIFKERKR